MAELSMTSWSVSPLGVTGFDESGTPAVSRAVMLGAIVSTLVVSRAAPTSSLALFLAQANPPTSRLSVAMRVGDGICMGPPHG